MTPRPASSYHPNRAGHRGLGAALAEFIQKEVEFHDPPPPLRVDTLLNAEALESACGRLPGWLVDGRRPDLEAVNDAEPGSGETTGERYVGSRYRTAGSARHPRRSLGLRPVGSRHGVVDAALERMK